MKQKSSIALKQLQSFNTQFSKVPQSLKEYSEYIESYNEVLLETADGKMEKKKIEIEEMHFELKQRFDVNPLKTTDTV